ncbi:carbohydrate-binding domain-containing protein [uncultured Prevotella sp.]|uniref:carbohydrate-binding domain-containing protein n=1 Tax=uncultured Prevotella sp. TaxID=159272 RepID=UPI00259306EA|nr:carbohydrate-binding domain-containing protein [uncultured Prevotella sp.]
MKKLIGMILMAVAIIQMAYAQTLNVQVGNVTYAIPAAQAGDMTYQNGTSLTVMGKTLQVADITRMYVDNSSVTDNMVSVEYSGDEATVTIAGNVARYVDASVEGAHVSLKQSAEVGDETCGEITYSLSGTSTDGEFYMEGAYKATVELRGLTLTNPSGAPLNIQDGKRIELSVKKDTENTLTDALSGSQKGCLVCKGHLELKGKGTLNIYGNTAHGIYAKEYVSLKNCTVNVLSAVKDGVNCNQYFLMEGGTLSVGGVADDGVQVSYKDDTDREAEDTGSITITGGTLNIAVTGTATKGLKADGNVDVSGGDITITTSGGGKWDEADQKTKAATCISADGNVNITAGTLLLASTGSGGKGISCDGDLVVGGGDITVNTSGGMYAYVNGNEYTDYTGNIDYLTSDQKSSPKGMKADGNVTINGGTISVTTTGNGGEGIESKAVLTINDGTIVVNSNDDAINSSSHMYIKGGDITVVATDNDGLDSNGNMYISGGVIRAFGTRSPECGIDANEEGGYSVIFTGGTLLAVGGGNSVPGTSESTQPYVQASMSVTAGTEVTLKSGDMVLATFTVPSNYSSSNQGGGMWTAAAPGGGGGPGGGGFGGGGFGGSSVLVSCAGLTSGSSYTLTSGTASSTVTATLQGNSGGRPW